MRISVTAAMVSLLALSVATPASAADRDPGVNARQHRQHHRIIQGIHSGELTRTEVRALAAEQRDIRQEERVFKSDGQLTRAERVELHQDLNEASRDIYQEKHDGERQPRAR